MTTNTQPLTDKQPRAQEGELTLLVQKLLQSDAHPNAALLTSTTDLAHFLDQPPSAAALISALSQRAAWLNEFGRLITLIGLPPEQARADKRADLPINAYVRKLLDKFEMGHDLATVQADHASLPHNAATLTYLLLKGFVWSSGKDAHTGKQFAQSLQMWVSSASQAQPGMWADCTVTEDVLVAWCQSWGLEDAELRVRGLQASQNRLPPGEKELRYVKLKEISEKANSRDLPMQIPRGADGCWVVKNAVKLSRPDVEKHLHEAGRTTCHFYVMRERDVASQTDRQESLPIELSNARPWTSTKLRIRLTEELRVYWPLLGLQEPEPEPMKAANQAGALNTSKDNLLLRPIVGDPRFPTGACFILEVSLDDAALKLQQPPSEISLNIYLRSALATEGQTPQVFLKTVEYVKQEEDRDWRSLEKKLTDYLRNTLSQLFKQNPLQGEVAKHHKPM